MRIGRVAMRLGDPSSPRHGIARNAASVLAARVTGAVATTAVVVIAAHRLDTDDFGLVVSTMAAGFIANTVITFGTDTVVTRSFAAEEPDAPALGRAALRLQFGLSAAVITAAVVGVMVGAPSILFIEALSMIPLAVVTVAGAALRGVQRMHHLLVAAGTGSAVTLVATVVGFAIDTRVEVPIIARLLGAVAAAGVLAHAAKRHRSRPSGATLGVAAVVGRAAPFAGSVILAGIGAQAGVLLVELAGDDPSGGYGAASRLLEASRLIPAAAVTAFFPTMMGGLHNTAPYRRWTRQLFAYSLVVVVGLLVAAGPIDRMLFDRQPEGAALIRVLAFALPPTVARLLLSFEAIAEGRERTVLLSAGAATATMLGAGFAAAVTIGPQGVAWAQVASLVAAVAILAIDRARSATQSPSTAVGPRKGDVRHRNFE